MLIWLRRKAGRGLSDTLFLNIEPGYNLGNSLSLRMTYLMYVVATDLLLSSYSINHTRTTIRHNHTFLTSHKTYYLSSTLKNQQARTNKPTSTNTILVGCNSPTFLSDTWDQTNPRLCQRVSGPPCHV